MSLNILLFGMGGIGSTYAYLFSQAGANTHVVARSNHKTLSENGLSIDSVKFGKKESVKFAGVWRSAEDAHKGLGEGKGFDYIVCKYDNKFEDGSEDEEAKGREGRLTTAIELRLRFVLT
jgi:predicted dinucleotide-binding enzyme